MNDIGTGLAYLTPVFIIIAMNAADKSDLHAPIDMKYVNFVLAMTIVMTIAGLVYLIKGSYELL